MGQREQQRWRKSFDQQSTKSAKGAGRLVASVVAFTWLVWMLTRLGAQLAVGAPQG